ncbi:MAG: hypothetical protein V4568_06335 [Pseudomonadota bacterium]
MNEEEWDDEELERQLMQTFGQWPEAEENASPPPPLATKLDIWKRFSEVEKNEHTHRIAEELTIRMSSRSLDARRLRFAIFLKMAYNLEWREIRNIRKNDLKLTDKPWDYTNEQGDVVNVPWQSRSIHVGRRVINLDPAGIKFVWDLSNKNRYDTNYIFSDINGVPFDELKLQHAYDKFQANNQALYIPSQETSPPTLEVDDEILDALKKYKISITGNAPGRYYRVGMMEKPLRQIKKQINDNRSGSQILQDIVSSGNFIAYAAPFNTIECRAIEKGLRIGFSFRFEKKHKKIYAFSLAGRREYIITDEVSHKLSEQMDLRALKREIGWRGSIPNLIWLTVNPPDSGEIDGDHLYRANYKGRAFELYARIKNKTIEGAIKHESSIETQRDTADDPIAISDDDHSMSGSSDEEQHRRNSDAMEIETESDTEEPTNTTKKQTSEEQLDETITRELKFNNQLDHITELVEFLSATLSPENVSSAAQFVRFIVQQENLNVNHYAPLGENRYEYIFTVPFDTLPDSLRSLPSIRKSENGNIQVILGASVNSDYSDIRPYFFYPLNEYVSEEGHEYEIAPEIRFVDDSGNDDWPVELVLQQFSETLLGHNEWSALLHHSVDTVTNDNDVQRIAMQFDFNFDELPEVLKNYAEDRGNNKIALYLVIDEDDKVIQKLSLCQANNVNIVANRLHEEREYRKATEELSTRFPTASDLSSGASSKSSTFTDNGLYMATADGAVTEWLKYNRQFHDVAAIGRLCFHNTAAEIDDESFAMEFIRQYMIFENVAERWSVGNCSRAIYETDINIQYDDLPETLTDKEKVPWISRGENGKAHVIFIAEVGYDEIPIWVEGYSEDRERHLQATPLLLGEMEYRNDVTNSQNNVQTILQEFSKRLKNEGFWPMMLDDRRIDTSTSGVYEWETQWDFEYDDLPENLKPYAEDAGNGKIFLHLVTDLDRHILRKVSLCQSENITEVMRRMMDERRAAIFLKKFRGDSIEIQMMDELAQAAGKDSAIELIKHIINNGATDFQGTYLCPMHVDKEQLSEQLEATLNRNRNGDAMVGLQMWVHPKPLNTRGRVHQLATNSHERFPRLHLISAESIAALERGAEEKNTVETEQQFRKELVARLRAAKDISNAEGERQINELMNELDRDLVYERLFNYEDFVRDRILRNHIEEAGDHSISLEAFTAELDQFIEFEKERTEKLQREYSSTTRDLNRLKYNLYLYNPFNRLLGKRQALIHQIKELDEQKETPTMESVATNDEEEVLLSTSNENRRLLNNYIKTLFLVAKIEEIDRRIPHARRVAKIDVYRRLTAERISAKLRTYTEKRINCSLDAGALRYLSDRVMDLFNARKYGRRLGHSKGTWDTTKNVAQPPTLNQFKLNAYCLTLIQEYDKRVDGPIQELVQALNADLAEGKTKFIFESYVSDYIKPELGEVEDPAYPYILRFRTGQIINGVERCLLGRVDGGVLTDLRIESDRNREEMRFFQLFDARAKAILQHDRNANNKELRKFIQSQNITSFREFVAKVIQPGRGIVIDEARPDILQFPTDDPNESILAQITHGVITDIRLAKRKNFCSMAFRVSETGNGLHEVAQLAQQAEQPLGEFILGIARQNEGTIIDPAYPALRKYSTGIINNEGEQFLILHMEKGRVLDAYVWTDANWKKAAKYQLPPPAMHRIFNREQCGKGANKELANLLPEHNYAYLRNFIQKFVTLENGNAIPGMPTTVKCYPTDKYEGGKQVYLLAEVLNGKIIDVRKDTPFNRKWMGKQAKLSSELRYHKIQAQGMEKLFEHIAKQRLQAEQSQEEDHGFDVLKGHTREKQLLASSGTHLNYDDLIEDIISKEEPKSLGPDFPPLTVRYPTGVFVGGEELYLLVRRRKKTTTEGDGTQELEYATVTLDDEPGRRLLKRQYEQEEKGIFTLPLMQRLLKRDHLRGSPIEFLATQANLTFSEFVQEKILSTEGEVINPDVPSIKRFVSGVKDYGEDVYIFARFDSDNNPIDVWMDLSNEIKLPSQYKLTERLRLLCVFKDKVPEVEEDIPDLPSFTEDLFMPEAMDFEDSGVQKQQVDSPGLFVSDDEETNSYRLDEAAFDSFLLDVFIFENEAHQQLRKYIASLSGNDSFDQKLRELVLSTVTPLTAQSTLDFIEDEEWSQHYSGLLTSEGATVLFSVKVQNGVICGIRLGVDPTTIDLSLLGDNALMDLDVSTGNVEASLTQGGNVPIEQTGDANEGNESDDESMASSEKIAYTIDEAAFQNFYSNIVFSEDSGYKKILESIGRRGDVFDIEARLREFILERVHPSNAMLPEVGEDENWTRYPTALLTDDLKFITLKVNIENGCIRGLWAETSLLSYLDAIGDLGTFILDPDETSLENRSTLPAVSELHPSLFSAVPPNVPTMQNFALETAMEGQEETDFNIYSTQQIPNFTALNASFDASSMQAMASDFSFTEDQVATDAQYVERENPLLDTMMRESALYHAAASLPVSESQMPSNLLEFNVPDNMPLTEQGNIEETLHFAAIDASAWAELIQSVADQMNLSISVSAAEIDQALFEESELRGAPLRPLLPPPDDNPVEIFEAPQALNPDDPTSPLVYCRGKGNGKWPFYHQYQVDRFGCPWYAINSFLLGKVDPVTGIDENGRTPLNKREFYRISALMMKGINPDTNIKEGDENPLSDEAIAAIVREALSEQGAEGLLVDAYLKYDAMKYDRAKYDYYGTEPFVQIGISELAGETDDRLMDDLLNDPTNTRNEIILQVQQGAIDAEVNSHYITLRRYDGQWYEIDSLRRRQKPTTVAKVVRNRLKNGQSVRAFVTQNINDPLVKHNFFQLEQISTPFQATKVLFGLEGLHSNGFMERITETLSNKLEIQDFNRASADEKEKAFRNTDTDTLAILFNNALGHENAFHVGEVDVNPHSDNFMKVQPGIRHAIIQVSEIDQITIPISRENNKSPWKVISEKGQPNLDDFIKQKYEERASAIKGNKLGTEDTREANLKRLDDALTNAKAVVLSPNLDIKEAGEAIKKYVNDATQYGIKPLVIAAPDNATANTGEDQKRLTIGALNASKQWENKRKKALLDPLYQIWKDAPNGGARTDRQFKQHLIIADLVDLCSEAPREPYRRFDGTPYPDTYVYTIPDAWGTTCQIVVKHDGEKVYSLWPKAINELEYTAEQMFDDYAYGLLEKVLTTDFLLLDNKLARSIWDRKTTQKLFKPLIDLIQKQIDDGEILDIKKINQDLLKAIINLCGKLEGDPYQIKDEEGNDLSGFYRYSKTIFGIKFSCIVQHDGDAAKGLWLESAGDTVNDKKELVSTIQFDLKRQPKKRGRDIALRPHANAVAEQIAEAIANRDPNEAEEPLQFSPNLAAELIKGRAGARADVKTLISRWKNWTVNEKKPNEHKKNHYAFVDIATTCKPSDGESQGEFHAGLQDVYRFTVKEWPPQFDVYVWHDGKRVKHIWPAGKNRKTNLEHIYNDICTREKKSKQNEGESPSHLKLLAKQAQDMLKNDYQKKEFATLIESKKKSLIAQFGKDVKLPPDYQILIDIAKSCHPQKGKIVKDESGNVLPGIYEYDHFNEWGRKFTLLIRHDGETMQGVRILTIDKKEINNESTARKWMVFPLRRQWLAERRLEEKLKENKEKSLALDYEKAYSLIFDSKFRQLEFTTLMDCFQSWRDKNNEQPNIYAPPECALMEIAKKCHLKKGMPVKDLDGNDIPNILDFKIQLWGEKFHVYARHDGENVLDFRLGEQQDNQYTLHNEHATKGGLLVEMKESRNESLGIAAKRKRPTPQEKVPVVSAPKRQRLSQRLNPPAGDSSKDKDNTPAAAAEEADASPLMALGWNELKDRIEDLKLKFVYATQQPSSRKRKGPINPCAIAVAFLASKKLQEAAKKGGKALEKELQNFVAHINKMVEDDLKLAAKKSVTCQHYKLTSKGIDYSLLVDAVRTYDNVDTVAITSFSRDKNKFGQICETLHASGESIMILTKDESAVTLTDKASNEIAAGHFVMIKPVIASWPPQWRLINSMKEDELKAELKKGRPLEDLIDIYRPLLNEQAVVELAGSVSQLWAVPPYGQRTVARELWKQLKTRQQGAEGIDFTGEPEAKAMAQALKSALGVSVETNDIVERDDTFDTLKETLEALKKTNANLKTAQITQNDSCMIGHDGIFLLHTLRNIFQTKKCDTIILSGLPAPEICVAVSKSGDGELIVESVPPKGLIQYIRDGQKEFQNKNWPKQIQIIGISGAIKQSIPATSRSKTPAAKRGKGQKKPP